MTKKTNPDFLNGVPELLILQLLERRPLHGYDLVQAIHDASGRKLDFGEGCIYPVLHRLEAQKLLSSRRSWSPAEIGSCTASPNKARKNWRPRGRPGRRSWPP